MVFKAFEGHSVWFSRHWRSLWGSIKGYQKNKKEELQSKLHLFYSVLSHNWPGRVAKLVGHLTRKSEVLGLIPGLATYFRFSFRFSHWRKYVHVVLGNRLGDLSLSRKSVVRSNDRPDITIDVYRGRKTTTNQQQQYSITLGTTE